MKKYTVLLFILVFCISVPFSLAAATTTNLPNETNKLEKLPLWKQKIITKFDKTLEKTNKKANPDNILAKSPKFFLIGWLLGWTAYFLFIIIAIAAVIPALAWIAYICALLGTICASIWILKKLKVIA